MFRQCLALTLLTASASVVHAQTSLSFETYGDAYQTGNGPIISGDFNNDGKPDLVQCCNSGKQLIFRAGKGDGTFQPAVAAFATAVALQGAVASDVNHDGKLDLVSIAALNPPTPPAPGSYALTIWLGNGDGTFRSPDTYATTQGPGTAVVGNFFNDGYPDIAVGESYGVIDFFRNNGNGTFVYSRSQTIGSGNFSPVQLAAGTLNGDDTSHLAAVVLNSNDFAMPWTLSVLWNDGKGNFTQNELGSYYFPQVTTGRVNGDGASDILVSYSCSPPSGASYCAGFDAYFGQGQNKLAKRSLVQSSDGVNPGDMGQIAATDVNGDGYGDIAAVGALQCDGKTGRCDDAPQGLFVWLGNADGSFQQKPQSFLTSRNVQVGSATMADFNRDGMMDFAQTQTGAGGPTEFYINATLKAGCGTYTISPAVTVCSPVDGTYVPGSVRVQANTYDTTPVTALQEYIDGVLQFSKPVTTLDTTFSVTPGSHLFVTKAWDASGRNFFSPRNITVYNGTPGATCFSAPNSASLCLPAGTSSARPVSIVGNGNTGAFLTTSAQLYIDGKLVINNEAPCGTACYSVNTLVQTEQRLAPGSHNLVFKVWDLGGHVYQAQKLITVQ